MKKLLPSILSAIIMLSFTAVCRAHTIEDTYKGISYVLSDNWVCETNEDSSTSFYHASNRNETISLNISDVEPLNSIENVSDETLNNICEELYSNNAISRLLSEINETRVTVKTESVISSREYYNGILFYRYEKAYIASAAGVRATGFYMSGFITIKNGRLYLIVYERDDTTNNFNDVFNMLGSISFEPGHIKIKINGELIYPDSDPFIYEGRTLVPIRAVAEKMNYSVAWDAINKLVILRSNSGDNILHFQIEDNVALRNYKEFVLDVPATITNGRTFLPLRAVAEAMDAEVNWNQNERIIDIIY